MIWKTISEARKELPSLLDSAARVTVTRHGKPAAVILDYADYRQLMTAWELAKDPQRLQRLVASHRRFESEAAAHSAPAVARATTIHEGTVGPRAPR